MPKKEINIVLVLGILINLFAILFMAYLYFVSIPKESDLKFFSKVMMPKIDDSTLEAELNDLKKVTGVPIEIEYGELGKENPFF